VAEAANKHTVAIREKLAFINRLMVIYSLKYLAKVNNFARKLYCRYFRLKKFS
jgi:hypothetical protein